MTLYNIMEIFHRRQQDLQQIKNAFILHPPPFQPRGTIPRPLPNQQHQQQQQQPLRHPTRHALVPPPANQEKPHTSFLINDILSGNVGSKLSPREDSGPGVVVRPWDEQGSSRSSSPVDEEVEEEIDVGDEKPQKKVVGKNSPLDALFKMTTKTFDGNDGSGILGEGGQSRDQMSGLFSKNQSSKKRRKSRTAFSNQQIYELEKRFLYQKYLTPADRDEIAQQLNLTNAQVITWFQNRRAKLKRDLEELKADVTAAKVQGTDPPTVLTRLEEMQAYTTQQSLIKWEKRALKMPGKYPTGFNPLSLLDDHKDRSSPFSPHKDSSTAHNTTTNRTTLSPHSSSTEGHTGTSLIFSPHHNTTTGQLPPLSPTSDTVVSEGMEDEEEGGSDVMSESMDTSVTVSSSSHHLSMSYPDSPHYHTNPNPADDNSPSKCQGDLMSSSATSPTPSVKAISADDVTGCQNNHHNRSTQFHRDHVRDTKTPD